MGKRTIEFDLSEEGLARAIRDIELYRDAFLKACADAMQELVDDGIMYAKAQIESMGAIESGELLGSIQGYYEPDKHVGVIYSDCWYAIFVEYGTGIVGQQNPHPDPPASWTYDVNEYGDAGWYYYDAEQGRGRWTKGQASARFLYEAKKLIRNNAPKKFAAMFR